MTLTILPSGTAIDASKLDIVTIPFVEDSRAIVLFRFGGKDHTEYFQDLPTATAWRDAFLSSFT